jgi:secreted PhoX family phosphatase
MTELTAHGFAYSDGDVDTNTSSNPSLNAMIEQRYSRRQALRSGAVAASAAVFGGAVLAGCDSAATGSDPFPTIVSVGSSGASKSGRVVTLTGNATDNGPTASVWIQTQGPAVTLSNPNAATTSFIAPSVAGGTTLRFDYRAVDSAGQVSTQSVTVAIEAAELGFTSIAKNRNDIVTVPAGYSVTVLTRLGDPIASGVPAYKNDGTDTDFANRIGDHGDALYWYGLSAAGARDDNSSVRGLLVQNHENLNVQYLHPAGPTTPGGVRPEAEALKEIEAHGVSVTEIVEGAGRAWTYVQNSTFNRRITPSTPMVFNGPVRGATLLRTPYSTDGTAGRGTINNCANGHTLWGTNITCEENWAGYFRRSGDDAQRTPRELVALRRYGVTSSSGSYGWSTVTPADTNNTLFRRWDARATAGGTATTDWRNEPNQFGWVVEIDPYDKTKAPRKRTALGRMGHEGAWLGNATPGKKLAVYLGDDSRGEYFYKFVSNTTWTASDAQAS